MDKVEMLARLLQAEGRGPTIVFCRTKRTAQKTSEELIERGFKSTTIHGDLGQSAREKALNEFKSGKRANPIMTGMVAALSDDDMKNIAAWLGTKKAAPGAASDKALIALGERIYRGGIADRQIAACAGCHSPNGAGIPAQYPRLSGQHADYTAAQLTAFRDGVRQNSLQMTQVAAKLNDREIKAVADYIAGLR